ncbi:uncharacterized protein LOC105844343 isoform X2 [Hydra vulgaris]|uniref:uncharacterized protein LOC105844343 isoform X2 n=1 Tax=Hydra vulgaris TaxID=6087 RepID=UPI0032EA5E47
MADSSKKKHSSKKKSKKLFSHKDRSQHQSLKKRKHLEKRKETIEFHPYDQSSFVDSTPQVNLFKKKRKKEKKETPQKLQTKKYDQSSFVDSTPQVNLFKKKIKKEKKETPQKLQTNKYDLPTMIILSSSDENLEQSNDQTEKIAESCDHQSITKVIKDVPRKSDRKQEKVMNRTRKHLHYDSSFSISPVSAKHSVEHYQTEIADSLNSPRQVCKLSKLDTVYGNLKLNDFDKHKLPPKDNLLLSWHATQKSLDEKGVKYVAGKWTDFELSILNANIKRFVDENGISDFKKFYNDHNAVKPPNMYVELGQNIYRTIRKIKFKVESLYDKSYIDASKSNSYSEEEIKKLFELYKVYGPRWKLIGKEMGRKPSSVKSRYGNSKMFYNYENKMRNGPSNSDFFTKEEDGKLVELVSQISKDYPDNIRWSHVSKLMGTRTANACRQRWLLFHQNRGNISKPNILLRKTMRSIVDSLVKSNVTDQSSIDWTALLKEINSEISSTLIKKTLSRYMIGEKFKNKTFQQRLLFLKYKFDTRSILKF